MNGSIYGQSRLKESKNKVLLAVVMIVICEDEVGSVEDNDDEDGIDSKSNIWSQ